VLTVPGGKAGGRVAILSTSRRRGGDLRLRAITADRRLITLGPKDFPGPPAPVGHVSLPSPYAPNNSSFQRQVASALTAAKVRSEGVSSKSAGGRREWRQALAQSHEAAAAGHPVAACPDALAHLRALDRADRLARDLDRLQRRVQGRLESLARQFDRVLRVLEAWGYVDGWSLTADGERLARLYHESDLLIAECLGQGLLDGLGEAEMAGLMSIFTFEARGQSEATNWFPNSRLRRRWTDVEKLALDLNSAEEDAGLPLTRRPDPGFVGFAHAWAAGEELSEVIEDEEMSGGDFVRNVKQLIDLLRQVGELAPEPATAKAARAAADRLLRGVVAASSVVSA
jgi:ATP-dependent RNA helicase HelY